MSLSGPKEMLSSSRWRVHGVPHTPRITFRHPPPNSARFSYATEGILFISAQLSIDAVSALRKVRVLINHTPSIAFRHLPPNSARFSYATEGALFISAQLSNDAVSALQMMMMSWCLMSSDVIWHIRDKLWPMPKHGSIKSTYVRCMRV